MMQWSMSEARTGTWLTAEQAEQKLIDIVTDDELCFG